MVTGRARLLRTHGPPGDGYPPGVGATPRRPVVRRHQLDQRKRPRRRLGLRGWRPALAPGDRRGRPHRRARSGRSPYAGPGAADPAGRPARRPATAGGGQQLRHISPTPGIPAGSGLPVFSALSALGSDLQHLPVRPDLHHSAVPSAALCFFAGAGIRLVLPLATAERPHPGHDRGAGARRLVRRIGWQQPLFRVADHPPYDAVRLLVLRAGLCRKSNAVPPTAPAHAGAAPRHGRLHRAGDRLLFTLGTAGFHYEVRLALPDHRRLCGGRVGAGYCAGPEEAHPEPNLWRRRYPG